MTHISPSRSKPKSLHVRWLSLLLLALFLAGCAAGTMQVQPYNRPLSSSDFFPDGRSARTFAAGTVPQTDKAVNDPSVTGLDANGQPLTSFPAPVTSAQIKRGQERYGIYCTVCHGIDGHGDGKAVTFGFPKPPDLLGTEAKGLANGKIFDIIANGQGKMFSYGYRVKADDRWAVIAYLRAMQLKNGHLTQDLTPDELGQLGK